VKIGDSMIKKESTQREKKKVKKISFRRKDSSLGKSKLTGFKLTEVSLLVAAATIVGVLSGSFLTYNLVSRTGGGSFTNSKYINEFKEAFDNILDNYYEKVDKDALIDDAINGMLSNLDGYTSYMNEEEKQAFDERMNGVYKGIGIEFITTVNNEHIITGVFDNTPAATAGVQKNDQIIKIDDIDASTKNGNELAAYIKGSNISEITMVVKRNNENITLKIKKAVVTLPSVSKKTFTQNGKKVGYINISIFANNTYDQFKDALTSLEKDGISSLIIDVRDNSGGFLHTANNIIELFLEKNKIMYQTSDKKNTIKYYDETEEARTYPVALLINGNSASASEVLTAALEENINAQVIGTTSFGKGTVQQEEDLSSGGMIKVTTNKWLTPTGKWIDKVGIKPTIEVALSTNYQTNPTDENDNQLQKAIEVLAK
jgi:carboxyl-terminal processing protease